MLFREALHYLEKVAGLYPSGLPVSLIKETATLPAGELLVSGDGSVASYGSNAPRFVFIAGIKDIFDADLKEPFYGSTGDLLEGAIRKGLKLDCAEATVIGINLGTFDMGFFREHVRALNPEGIIVFGAQVRESLQGVALELLPSRGEWGSLFGVPVICTCDLGQASQDANSKRELWKDLKKVISRYKLF